LHKINYAIINIINNDKQFFMQTKISQYLINGIKTHIIEIPTLDLTYAQV